MSAHTIDRICATARASRRTGSRSTTAGRTWTYAELDARSDELAARARARRPRLDADRQLGRARRADVRVREGGRDPASDLVAPRAGRGRLPARRRRARRASSSRTSTARWPRRRSRSPTCRAGPSSSTPRQVAGSGAADRRPAAPDLHLGHDRASRRARCSRTRTASGRTSRSTSRPASGRDDVVLQVLPQFHCGGWNVQPLLAWWKGATRRARARLRRGARARADRARSASRR